MSPLCCAHGVNYHEPRPAHRGSLCSQDVGDTQGQMAKLLLSLSAFCIIWTVIIFGQCWGIEPRALGMLGKCLSMNIYAQLGFWDRVLLFSSGWPWTHLMSQAKLQIFNLSYSASLALWLQADITTPTVFNNWNLDFWALRQGLIRWPVLALDLGFSLSAKITVCIKPSLTLLAMNKLPLSFVSFLLTSIYSSVRVCISACNL